MSDLGDIAVVRLDKEAGITSHDAVDRLRRVVGTRRVGHAGTLDPFATGLLLLAWGRATRLLAFLSGAPKTYRATLEFGRVTDTGDFTGTTQATSDSPVDEARVREASSRFRGTIEQRAPVYSAIKQDGEPLYARARRGEAVEPPVRRVHIHDLSIVAFDAPARRLVFDVTCSSGTYVRSLAADWGQEIGTGATLTALRRTSIGPHTVDGAIPTADLTDRPVGSIPEWNERLADAGFTAEEALAFLPSLVLDPREAALLATGRAPSRRRALDAGIGHATAALVFHDGDGKLLGVGALEGDQPSDAPLDLRLVWAAAEGARA